MYNEVLVVEGKNDKARLLAIYPNLNVITTNGSEISNETLEMIKELSLNHKIILFLDPDYPGERIREKINNYVDGCENVFIEKKLAIDERKHKVGIEHASFDDIKRALENRITYSNKSNKYTMKDLFDLGLVGQDDSAKKREHLAQVLHAGNPNGKTLLKRLNYIGIDLEEVRSILNEKNWDSK
jgi:ribonuclease M5